jgi:hypothetical protein
MSVIWIQLQRRSFYMRPGQKVRNVKLSWKALSLNKICDIDYTRPFKSWVQQNIGLRERRRYVHSRINTRSAREYTMFSPTQFLCKWREQRPSNLGDLDSRVTGEVATVLLHGSGPTFDFIWHRSTWLLLGLLFKWYTLYFLGTYKYYFI